MFSEKPKGICQICGKEFLSAHLFPAAMIRNSVLETARHTYKNWDPSGYICDEDLRALRALRIENLLEENKGELSKLDREVIESLKNQDIVAENINRKFEHSRTHGEKLSDILARFGGSWKFIMIFFLILAVWMGANAFFFLRPFDPYPFILLNLFLSCIAAVQAPIILMAQNRSAERDKLQADDNYRTNLMAELQVRQLHSKLDQFMKNQWDRLIELQEIQIDLAEELLKMNKH